MCVFKGREEGYVSRGRRRTGGLLKAPEELESWKVLELKMAKCCCAGQCQKCFTSTPNPSQNSTADVFFLIQPLGNPSAEQIGDAPGYPKVKVQKLLAKLLSGFLPAVRRLADSARTDARN